MTRLKSMICLFSALAFGFAACTDKQEEEPLPNPPQQEEEAEAEPVSFSYEQGSYAGVSLVYRKAIIAPSDNEKPALVIYLHGGSSKGSDNETQMKEKGIDSISNYLALHKINSIFIVPQCPSNKSWGGAMNRVVKLLIESYTLDNYADKERVYVFGGSMGGSGTWKLLSDYPELFRAAMPVAGNPAGCNVENVAQTPVLTVMGTDDAIMNIDTVEAFVGKLNSSGGQARLDIEQGFTHERTCIESYTTERLDYIFGRKNF